MLKVLFITSLILSAVYCDSFNRRFAEDVFAKLKNSELGKDLYTSIQLELSTSQSNEHIVDRILSMLQELFDSLTDSKNEAQSQRGDRRGFCATKLSDLQYEIDSLQEKITRAQMTLPTLQEQRENKVQSKEEKEQESHQNDNLLREINDRNEAGIARFQQSVADHNNMLDALRRAKQIISQLSVTSFLQKGPNEALIEIQKMGEQLSEVSKHKKSLLTVLMDLAQNVQADQDQVADIITIIDELLEHEQNTIRVEAKAEDLRNQRFEYDVTRFQESTQFLDATIKDLLADSMTLNTRVVELQTDVRNWRQNIGDKTEQHDLQNSACESDLAGLDRNIQEYNDLLDLVREVIRIFRSSSINDIRGVVSDS